jgi:hypothetical protein
LLVACSWRVLTNTSTSVNIVIIHTHSHVTAKTLLTCQSVKSFASCCHDAVTELSILWMIYTLHTSSPPPFYFFSPKISPPLNMFCIV